MYGAPGDTKAAVALDDFLLTLPREERLRLQGRAQDLFAAWAADGDPAVVKAGHIFAFFVGRLGGLIANLDQPTRPSPTGEPPWKLAEREAAERKRKQQAEDDRRAAEIVARATQGAST
jgi:hypothetical protein